MLRSTQTLHGLHLGARYNGDDTTAMGDADINERASELRNAADTDENEYRFYGKGKRR